MATRIASIEGWLVLSWLVHISSQGSQCHRELLFYVNPVGQHKLQIQLSSFSGYHNLTISDGVQPVSWASHNLSLVPLLTSWYICKPDALHGYSGDIKIVTRPDTETLYLQDRDETETVPFSKLSRPTVSTKCLETVSRLRRLHL